MRPGGAGPVRVTFHVGVMAILVLGLSGCSRKAPQAELAWRVSFFAMGAKIEFDADHREKIQRIRVFEMAGGLAAQLDLNGYAQRTESLYFQWKKAKAYRFEVTSGDGNEVQSKTAKAPQVDTRADIEIAMPYGAVTVDSANRSVEAMKSLVLQGSEMTATVLVRNGLEAPVAFEIAVYIPKSLHVQRLAPIWTSGADSVYRASGRLTVASEVWYSQLSMQIPAQSLDPAARIVGKASFENAAGERWERTATIPLRSATVAEIAAQVSVAAVVMPTGANGVADPRQRPNTITFFRPALGDLGRWLGVQAPYVNEFDPAAYQTVHLHNRSEETVHVLVSSLNRDVKRRTPVMFLAPPDAINAGTNRSLALVSLAPETTTTVPLPIYFNPFAPNIDQQNFSGAGRYERAIEVKVWGSDATVIHATYPLRIETPNLHATLVTSVVFLATLAGLILLLRYHQRLFRRFSTKHLILISLFGTTIFIAVTIPSTLFGNLASALLGPIAFLVTGLINGLLYYAVLTSLLMLIPRFGVITLVSAIRLLLGSVMLGLFTPVALLYTGAGVLLLEGGFQLSGRGVNLPFMALVFGVCEALAVYVDFQLTITLYRLFYADWYILARIFIDGLAYTFAGVLLGRYLGTGLRRVAE